jgi:hypothetical protein
MLSKIGNKIVLSEFNHIFSQPWENGDVIFGCGLDARIALWFSLATKTDL